jgi:hypothetical protein
MARRIRASGRLTPRASLGGEQFECFRTDGARYERRLIPTGPCGAGVRTQCVLEHNASRVQGRLKKKKGRGATPQGGFTYIRYS